MSEQTARSGAWFFVRSLPLAARRTESDRKVSAL